jgi:hypothetical protein
MMRRHNAASVLSKRHTRQGWSGQSMPLRPDDGGVGSHSLELLSSLCSISPSTGLSLSGT